MSYCSADLKCLNTAPCAVHCGVLHVYGFEVSQPTRSVLLLCTEGKLNWELHQTFPPQAQEASYLAINPEGAVPALVDGDLKLSEGAAILIHIAETRGLKDWYPSDAHVRAKVNQWLHWHHTASRGATTKALVPLIFKQDKAAADAYLNGDFKYVLDRLEHQLKETDFLAGPHKTIADLMILTELDQLKFLHIADNALEGHPKVQAWMARLTAEMPTYAENVATAQKVAQALISPPQ